MDITITNAVLIFITITNLILGFYVLTQQPNRWLSRVFFVIEFGIALFVAGFLLLSSTGNFIFDKPIHYGALLFVFGFYLFSASFPHDKIPKARWWLSSLPIVIFAILVVPLNLIVESISIGENNIIIPQHGPMIGPYALMFVGYILASIGLLINTYRRVSGIARTQVQYLFLGIGVFIFITLITNALLPAVGVTNFILLGPISSIGVSTIMAYAIIRHEFLDIRVVIQRGLIYTILFAFIVTVYVSTLVFTSLIFNLSDIINDFFGGLLTSIIGITSVPQLDSYLRNKTDRWFFKDHYDYSKALHELSIHLQSSLELDTLLQTCEKSLTTILRAKNVTIKPQKTTSHDGETALTIPIKLRSKLTGMIHVGPKKSGEVYTEKDKGLLETFANQAATAMSRVFLYQEVRRRAEELEVKVTERTQELKDTQEQQRLMMLHISHNLQTPLAILQNKIERLKKTTPESDSILNLERSLEHTSQFIHDLLKLARLDSGYEEIKKADFNISDFLQELADEVTIIAELDGVTINSEIESNVTINTDYLKLREIVMNLLSNAVKYMGPIEPKLVTISLTKTDTHIMLAIQDTGIGIPAEDIATIFNNFDRGTSQAKASGTGLGLSISKKMLTQLGGTVTVTSKVGHGTTFTIQLPLR